MLRPHIDGSPTDPGAQQVRCGLQDGLDTDLADAARLDGLAARRVLERPAWAACELHADDPTAPLGAPGAELDRVGRPIQSYHRRPDHRRQMERAAVGRDDEAGSAEERGESPE
jgi:hypothetical protein